MKALRILIVVLVAGLCLGMGGNKMIESAREVKERHVNRVMSIPGVVSMGIAEGRDGKLVFVVGIEKQTEATMTKIPKEIEGYPVKVEVVGSVRAQ